MIFWYLLFYAFLLLYGAAKLGIGPDEAKILFASSGWLYRLAVSMYRLDASELVVRLPVVIVATLNVYLFYLLARRYLKKSYDAFFAAVLYSLLPAVLGAGVILNKAPFLIFFTALLLLLSPLHILGMVLALCLLFLDKAFAILFLALGAYAIYKRRWKTAAFYLLLFVASLTIFGFDVGGKPKSYFLDTFAIFGAIFSPLLFLYFFYVIYRILVKERKDILWFVSAIAFLFALFLSFRQKILLLDFAPFAVFGVILMVRTFLHSVRSRLPRYRKRFYWVLLVVLFFMLLNDFALIFNDFFIGRIPRHFAKQYYVGKLLAQKLRQKKIGCIESQERALALQLRFYGIGKCSLYRLNRKGGEVLNVKYNGKVFERYFVSKGNE